ncbi:MAG: hypothetical protein BWY45_03519 [Euryarchaeota archaeon ADurb.Bin294]|jgi:hypothetical protein|nr:MAG: hypothetical protein BWY45_03519 [Euryarchaeota archaeon ADurb.Bin294]
MDMVMVEIIMGVAMVMNDRRMIMLMGMSLANQEICPNYHDKKCGQEDRV